LLPGGYAATNNQQITKKQKGFSVFKKKKNVRSKRDGHKRASNVRQNHR
jgi:hypothetical protein